VNGEGRALGGALRLRRRSEGGNNLQSFTRRKDFPENKGDGCYHPPAGKETAREKRGDPCVLHSGYVTLAVNPRALPKRQAKGQDRILYVPAHQGGEGGVWMRRAGAEQKPAAAPEVQVSSRTNTGAARKLSSCLVTLHSKYGGGGQQLGGFFHAETHSGQTGKKWTRKGRNYTRHLDANMYGWWDRTDNHTYARSLGAERPKGGTAGLRQERKAEEGPLVLAKARRGSDRTRNRLSSTKRRGA